MSVGRFYFADDLGHEMSEHPLNGSHFEGTGSYVDVKAAQAKIAGPYAKRRKEIWIIESYKPFKSRKVTTADFDNVAVRVTLWFPERKEVFDLVPE